MKFWVGKLFGTLRIACAVCLILVSVWALLLPPLFPFSAHAIINTKVVTVRTRDPGQIGLLSATKLDVLKAGDRIARVTRDLSKIQRVLAERQFTRQKLKEQLDSMDRTISERQKKLDEAEASLIRARQGAQQVLVQTQKSAVEKVRIYQESLAEKKANQARVAPLFKDGIITSAQWSEVREQTIEAEKSLMAAENELVQIQSRQDGLREGAGGLPQETEGVVARIGSDSQALATLRVQRLALGVELDEVDNQIASQKSYRDIDRSYELSTPIDGVVWRSQVVNGESVGGGDAVADMADAHAIFVEAYFRRDFMNSISVGDRASIYVIGESRFITGRVVDVQVQEHTASAPNIINTISLDAAMLRVSIEIEDKSALTTKNIGQLTKVLISGGSTGWLQRGLVWLSLYLRSHQ
ncbi:MAG: efflux RND transporter periplasmic adaptor subunit [Opitutaceae bacterium]|jgi:multidrug resistance efflux pump